jgi:hypothetical protein
LLQKIGEGDGIMYVNNLEKIEEKERGMSMKETPRRRMTVASSLNEISSAVGEGGDAPTPSFRRPLDIYLKTT